MSFTFGGSALTVLACEVASLVELLLVSFGEKAGARGLGLVVDVVEDCAYILGRVVVGVTGFSTCVQVVEDLLGKLLIEAGLRAPTDVEILAQARVGETPRSAGHFRIDAICC